MATPGIAAGAYARLARITDPAAGLTKPGAVSANTGDGPNFSKMLKDAVGSVVEAGRASDAQSQALVTTGKANIVDVVTAVAETETAVQAMVSVRDKMINAYEEIIRMQI
jgi:flagellar hook-basal body complex protein FliE